MKKLFCISMLTAIFSVCSLFAQNPVFQVTSSAVNLSKPLVFVQNPTISTSTGSITIGLPKCGLSFANIMGGLLTNSNVEQDPSAVNPGMYTYGYLEPQIDNFMDLGSSTKYFRNAYIKQCYVSANDKITSDRRYKENIKDLPEASSILLQLRPVSFDLKATNNESDTNALKNKVGFIAQEMMDVLPHLVGYLPEIDMYAVDYTSVIPYLVKAFQETQAEKVELEEQMAELQGQINALQELVLSLLAQNENTNATPKGKAPQQRNTAIEVPRLFQNLPNPFSQTTIIRYELPLSAGNAFLQVVDLNGRTVKSFQLNQTQGIGQIEISAGELSPGTYTYSLIVSGKLVDSKRMVVTQ